MASDSSGPEPTSRRRKKERFFEHGGAPHGFVSEVRVPCGSTEASPSRAAAAAGPRIARQHASRIAASQGEAEAAIPAPAPLPTQLSLVEKAVGDGVARVVGWWSELARAA